MGLGIYTCPKCSRFFTKREFGKLEAAKDKSNICKRKIVTKGDSKKGTKDKISYVGCGGKVISVEPLRTHKLIHSDFQASIEKFYYDILGRMFDLKYDPKKTKDTYTASEASDFWDNMERRKQFQAEQAMRYIASIGSMTKTIFQMVRELRILDQRLAHYHGREEGNESDDVALKGIWIDKVEGGTQRPTSVYAMAMQLGFATLPDLFYKLTPKTKSDVDKEVDRMKGEINVTVRNVLKRKLSEFMDWLERTKIELEDRRKFKLAYLRQHFHIIRMYLEWLRPYLQNVDALSVLSTGSRSGRAKTELIRATEGSVIDLELFGAKDLAKTKDYYIPSMRVVFHFNTIPMLVFNKQYNKGAAHVGMSTIEFEGYVLTKEGVAKYQEQELEDDIAVLAAVNSAILTYREELMKYLTGEGVDDEFAEGALNKLGAKAGGKDEVSYIKPPRRFKQAPVLRKAKKTASDDTWGIYDKFKKQSGMIRW